MSYLEKRAWLSLWTMGVPYLFYFAFQLAYPTLLTGMLEKIACLALAACVHAIGYVVGLVIVKRQERGEPLLEDERDRAIDGRATRWGYFVMLTGLIVAGMVMPFNKSGWEIVNTALLFIVLAETTRDGLTAMGYRRPRLAY